MCKPISARALYLRIANCILNQRDFVRTKGFFGPDRRRFQNPNFSGDERRGQPVDDGYTLDGQSETPAKSAFTGKQGIGDGMRPYSCGNLSSVPPGSEIAGDDTQRGQKNR